MADRTFARSVDPVPHLGKAPVDEVAEARPYQGKHEDEPGGELEQGAEETAGEGQSQDQE